MDGASSSSTFSVPWRVLGGPDGALEGDRETTLESSQAVTARALSRLAYLVAT